MSVAQAATTVAEPVARPRPRTRKQATRRRARGGILWIAVGGILLTPGNGPVQIQNGNLTSSATAAGVL